MRVNTCTPLTPSHESSQPAPGSVDDIIRSHSQRESYQWGQILSAFDIWSSNCLHDQAVFDDEISQSKIVLQHMHFVCDWFASYIRYSSVQNAMLMAGYSKTTKTQNYRVNKKTNLHHLEWLYHSLCAGGCLYLLLISIEIHNSYDSHWEWVMFCLICKPSRYSDSLPFVLQGTEEISVADNIVSIDFKGKLHGSVTDWGGFYSEGEMNWRI